MENFDTFFVIVGGMYLPEDEQIKMSCFYKNTADVSNCVFERKLFNGFKKCVSSNKLAFISAPSVGIFPKNSKKLFVNHFISKENFYSVSYFSTLLFGSLSKSIALKNKIRNIIKHYNLQNQKVCLIINELHLPYLKCAQYAKKKIVNSKVIQTN